VKKRLSYINSDSRQTKNAGDNITIAIIKVNA